MDRLLVDAVGLRVDRVQPVDNGPQRAQVVLQYPRCLSAVVTSCRGLQGHLAQKQRPDSQVSVLAEHSDAERPAPANPAEEEEPQEAEGEKVAGPSVRSAPR